MRFIFCLLLLSSAFASGAKAQDSPVYNKQGYNRGEENSTLYNTRTTGSDRGRPILLKSMLNESKARQGRASQAATPYNLSGNRGNGSSFSMTPDELRAKKKEHRDRALQRVKDEAKRRQQEQAAAAQRAAPADEMKEKRDAYASRFQNGGEATAQQASDTGQGRPIYMPKQRKAPVYLRDDNELTVPQKVFNSLR